VCTGWRGCATAKSEPREAAKRDLGRTAKRDPRETAKRDLGFRTPPLHARGGQGARVGSRRGNHLHRIPMSGVGES
jgi:hypothetical protein